MTVKQIESACGVDTQDQAEAAQPVRRTVKRLGFKERTLLVQAMEARRDELLHYCPHLEDVAEGMSKLLGFVVTPQHVRTVMNDSGMGWRPRRRRMLWPRSRYQQIFEKLEKALELLPLVEPKPDHAAEYARVEEAAEAFCEAVRTLYGHYVEGETDEAEGTTQK